MPSVEPPKHTQVLVIGGGPAGSYAAATLAREGLSVVLLEMSQFPRYHIGESLIPSVRHFLRFIDAEDKVAAHGFTRKPGSAIKFNQYMSEGYTDFVALGHDNNAWNVVRSEFDQILLQHASSCGARVFEQTRVTTLRFQTPLSDSQTASTTACASDSTTDCPPSSERSRSASVDFGPDSLGRPIEATYQTALGGTGHISFDYLVDASGRAGLMSTKYLKNRKFNESLKNVAIWGYWEGTGMYGEGTSRENAPFFEALSDESGWAWFIPLHKGLTSVGIVMESKQLGIRSRASSAASRLSSSSTSSSPSATSGRPRRPTLRSQNSSTLSDRYLMLLNLAPGVQELIGDATLVSVRNEEDEEQQEGPMARTASDFSYSAGRYAGPGWRIVGDAGAFIDPFFSSGIHLAMTSALSAAASICASVRGDCSEIEAGQWHNSRFSISYTRFLVVVLSAYKQIRAQSSSVLADIEEHNFDKAFEFLRPVIQGGAEMGTRLSEDEVQRALDFCVHLFDPTTPEQHEIARQHLQALSVDESCSFDRADSKTLHEEDERAKSRLLDPTSPIVDPIKLEKLLRMHLKLRSPFGSASCDSLSEGHTGGGETMSTIESEVKMVLDKVNARRVIHSEHGRGPNSLEEETVNGFVVRLIKGDLGLVRESDSNGK